MLTVCAVAVTATALRVRSVRICKDRKNLCMRTFASALYQSGSRYFNLQL